MDSRDSNLPLHVAAIVGQVQLVEALLTKRDGTPFPRHYLQRQNRWKCTPHDLAFLHDHRDIVTVLQKHCSKVRVFQAVL